MGNVLRIGVIGIGRRWHKSYKPALRRLRSSLRISVLCDAVQERAAREAKRLGCHAAAGPTHLLEHKDVEAVLLLDTQWFRLWPVGLACQLGKPVLCCGSLEYDDAHADALYRQVQESGQSVIMEMLPRFMPITRRLHRLFEAELGTPQLLECTVVRCGQPAHDHRTPTVDVNPVAGLVGGSGIAMLDWCAGFLGSEPVNVTARSLEATRFSSLFLEFAGGRGVQLTHRYGAVATVRLQVLAERGSALVKMPSRVSWITPKGFHSHTLRGQSPPAQVVLEHFRDVVQGSAAPEPTFADAYRVLRWLRVAARSREEGRLLSMSG